jgi:ABC-2 type transport system ATP-binding protein
MKLKASVPSKNVLEVSFSHVPDGWEARLTALPEVDSVNGHDHIFRISSKNGPATTMALLDAAAVSGVSVNSLSVESTTLDDVFVHYTGRDLRDALQDASPQDSSFMMRR